MDLINNLQSGIQQALAALYELQVETSSLVLTPTRKEFAGDYTLVVFPFTKSAKKAPEAIANDLGNYLKEHVELVVGFNVIKGFLNLEISEGYWLDFLKTNVNNKSFGKGPTNGQKVMVEYCSPNTNKPLHLGHIRNILLGASCAKILEQAGYDVIKTQIINDRGIHICKSMLTWMEEGNGETPASSGTKGDHLVGKYYVKYNGIEKAQKEALTAAGSKEEPEVLTKARAILKKWEDNDPETRKIWAEMNGWVYAGFAETYKALGVDFDKLYYESDTYLLGKKYVEQGLTSGLFFKKEDGSVWIDLEDAGMDQKIVLRADGTAVYMTQDIGTAQTRYDDYKMDKLVYVVGDEQNYHFKVLFEIMKRFGASYADGLFHLSYGMVDLPTGKMKSREGTVVDADDLIADVVKEARANAAERGTLVDMTDKDQDDVFKNIGLGALKYFILKVNPKKRMTFDPKESVELHGDTGPYIQNAFVRVKSVLNKAGGVKKTYSFPDYKLEAIEKTLLKLLFQFPIAVEQAAADYDPSTIANYCYDLGKNFHRFYNEHPIINDDKTTESFRLCLSKMVGDTLECGMGLLGIQMPNKM